MSADTLEECIWLLKKLRDAYHNQLDTRALVELNHTIDELTRLADVSRSDDGLATLGYRILQVIDMVVRVVTNVTDLMK